MIGKVTVTSHPGRPHPDACPACDGHGVVGSSHRRQHVCWVCGGDGRLPGAVRSVEPVRCQGCGDGTGMTCVVLCAACRRELAEWHGQTVHGNGAEVAAP